MRDVYGRIPREVETLLRQRRIDLLASGKAFSELLEYDDEISVVLSKEFSAINGIGNALLSALCHILPSKSVLYSKNSKNTNEKMAVDE